MNITVFGASGGIGGHVIALAAQRGHHVRAVYRAAPAAAPRPGRGPHRTGRLRPCLRPPGGQGRRRGGLRGRAELHHPPQPAHRHDLTARPAPAAGPDPRHRDPRLRPPGPADLRQHRQHGTRRCRHGPGAPAAVPLLPHRRRPQPRPRRPGPHRDGGQNSPPAAWTGTRRAPSSSPTARSPGNVRASDRVTVKPISRADVAWHILTLAEDPDPGPLRTPVITTGPGSKNGTAGTD